MNMYTGRNLQWQALYFDLPQTCQISGSKTWQESLPGWALVLGIDLVGIEHVNDHDASCWYGIAYIVNIASLCIWGVYYVYEILYSIYSTCVHHVHHGRFTHRASRLNVNFHIVFPICFPSARFVGIFPCKYQDNLWSSKTAMARYTEKKRGDFP
jgi:hypothetical protein